MFLAVAAIAGGASLLSGAMGSSAAQDAASIQANASENAAGMSLQATQASIAEQAREFNTTQANEAPYLATGQQGVYTLANLMGLNVPGSTVAPNAQTGSLLPTTLTPDQVMAQDPGYQFRLNQGTTALNNAASAGGMDLSSNTMQSLINYNQDYASNEYQNVWNRNQTTMQTLYNELAGVSGTGQNSVNALGTVGANTAASIGATGVAGAATAGNYLTSGAAAQAAGLVGSANAFGAGVNNATAGLQNQMLMSRLFSAGGGGGVQNYGGPGMGGYATGMSDMMSQLYPSGA